MEACRGLSYAHELLDDDGGPLDLVHRDVSPPNILISQARRGEGHGLRARQGAHAARAHGPGCREGQVQLPLTRGGERTAGRRARGHLCARRLPLGDARRVVASSSAKPTTRPFKRCQPRRCPSLVGTHAGGRRSSSTRFCRRLSRGGRRTAFSRRGRWVMRSRATSSTTR